MAVPASGLTIFNQLGFNQDKSCFAIAHGGGFAVFTVDPFDLMVNEDSSAGGMSRVEMYYRSNMLALIGGGNRPRYAGNKILLWDAAVEGPGAKIKGEIRFNETVRGVKLRKDIIVAVLERSVSIYSFQHLKLLETRKTVYNPEGICDVAAQEGHKIVAFPGNQVGCIQVELLDIQRQVVITAHDSAVQEIALSFDGSKVVSASDKGTLIRVFDTTSGTMLHELRRGIEKAKIVSLDFNKEATLVCCSSDKGTAHIFQLFGEGEEGGKKKNEGLVPSLMSGIVPKYFDSIRSVLQFELHSQKSKCVFSQDSKYLLALTDDGTFHKLRLDFDRKRVLVDKSYSFWPL